MGPGPREIYQRASDEGERRLSMPLLEQVTTAFIAGVTIIFGIVAFAVVEGLVAPAEGGPGAARVVGALAFAIGVVFLVVGRSELFSENFFDPVAAAVRHRGRRPWIQLVQLWVTTLVLNLVGGAVLVAVLTVEGALPSGAEEVFIRLAEETAHRSVPATLARAVLAGALVALLSYMLVASDSVMAQEVVAFLVGFFLALGPFDHVVVSVLQLLAGLWLGAAVGYGDLLTNLVLATLGNLAGGLLLITLTHTAQVKSG